MRLDERARQFALGFQYRPVTLRQSTIQPCAWDYASQALRRAPNMTETELASNVNDRIATLDGLAKKMQKLLEIHRIGGEPDAWAFEYERHLQNNQLSLAEKEKSFRLFFKIGRMTRPHPLPGGGATIQLRPFPHNESPVGIIVTNAEGKQIATVGGYILCRGGKTEFRVNNIQGTIRPARPETETPLNETEEEHAHALLKSRKDLEELTRVLKIREPASKNQDTWRTILVERIEERLRKNGWSVSGEIGRAPGEPSKKRRIARQYRQTYRKLGWMEGADGVFRPST